MLPAGKYVLPLPVLAVGEEPCKNQMSWFAESAYSAAPSSRVLSRLVVNVAAVPDVEHDCAVPLMNMGTMVGSYFVSSRNV
jgi:hypothetical protein